MAGQGNVFLYLVDLGRLDGGQRVFLGINLFGLQCQVELGESYWGRRCPDRLGIGNQKGTLGVRIFRPLRSAMELIGLLAVVCRVPSYQTSIRCTPFSRNFASMRWP